MNLKTHFEGNVLKVSVEGELSIQYATELKMHLLEALSDCHPGVEIDINLAQIGEIDTAGLQLLALAKREAAQRELALRFSSHSPAVLEMLDVSGLAGVFGDPVILPQSET